jgi:hypothetical protein
VVERPAAAVKELVENALDAGATRIAVSLEEGGIGRILVEDDGSGMSAAELDLAVERHATSKLPDEATLFRIATLGFRGEALPSIGAVARLTLTSRIGDGAAHAITVEGGRKSPVAPAAGPPGTRVGLRDLFFATPARRAASQTRPNPCATALPKGSSHPGCAASGKNYTAAHPPPAHRLPDRCATGVGAGRRLSPASRAARTRAGSPRRSVAPIRRRSSRGAGRLH